MISQILALMGLGCDDLERDSRKMFVGGYCLPRRFVLEARCLLYKDNQKCAERCAKRKRS